MYRIFIIMLLYVSSVNSQTIENPIASIEYFTTINLHVEELYDCKLIFNKIESAFIWSKTGNENVRTLSGGSLTKASHYDDKTINYINFANKSLNSQKYIYGKEEVQVWEDLPVIKWEITTERKLIGNYETLKAYTEFRGRKYTVWYAPELGYNVGPWKLNGLPGIILEAYDEAREIVFTVHRINFNPTPISFEITGEKVSLEKYYQKEIDYPFEMIKRINSKSARGSGVTISAVNYNFMEKDYEKLGEKIEKELSKN